MSAGVSPLPRQSLSAALRCLDAASDMHLASFHNFGRSVEQDPAHRSVLLFKRAKHLGELLRRNG